MSLGQGYTGSAWGRRATPPAPVAKAAPVAAARVAPVRATSIAYYDPSRVIKNIKIVKDLRQSGTERGETQTGDDSILGPESIAPPQTGKPGKPGTPGKNNLVPIALAVAAFLILGG